MSIFYIFLIGILIPLANSDKIGQNCEQPENSVLKVCHEVENGADFCYIPVNCEEKCLGKNISTFYFDFLCFCFDLDRKMEQSIKKKVKIEEILSFTFKKSLKIVYSLPHSASISKQKQKHKIEFFNVKIFTLDRESSSQPKGNYFLILICRTL